jgi:hypothetical protein
VAFPGPEQRKHCQLIVQVEGVFPCSSARIPHFIPQTMVFVSSADHCTTGWMSWKSSKLETTWIYSSLVAGTGGHGRSRIRCIRTLYTSFFSVVIISRYHGYDTLRQIASPGRPTSNWFFSLLLVTHSCTMLLHQLGFMNSSISCL